ncbi:hypothetical protein [Novosphingobium naphthalenivorans]|uniref:hypothetical protein n=1 Tax=Novosphingobium naphthalenivorans TaxID=273168 RepID=UPI0008315AE6|nr:hypothetical protein [Novosphingobium naphthalenivorans]
MAIAELQTKSTPVIPGVDRLRINGMTPFCSNDDNDADRRFSEAHALLTTLSSAIYADELIAPGERNVSDQRPEILACALEGIASLIALGMHHRIAASVAKGV